jgi:UDP-galactopyranose mutase
MVGGNNRPSDVLERLPATDLLVVGAGFYGLTVAERMASRGYRVLVIDRRDHVGGNAHSFNDEQTGIEVHKYGPHIFHTNSNSVFEYLSGFTAWVPFELRVWSSAAGQVYPMPINLATISLFLKRVMAPEAARTWVASMAGASGPLANLEDKAISLIGRPLYETFIKGYTLKQWQTDPRELPADIITRLPVRYTFDNRYFNDEFQFMPKDGYAAIFRRMVATPNLTVLTGVDWFDVRNRIGTIPVLYTGPIDRFFDYAHGELGWRTLDFAWEHHPSDYQGCPIMNYPDEQVPWTRVAEYRHLHPERDYGSATIISREFSRFARPEDEPYYPINTSDDKSRYDIYRARAQDHPQVIFGGRLGTYRYLDMHQAVGAALKAAEAEVLPRLQAGR